MQLAGAPCTVCDGKISSVLDGRECRSCRKAIHRSCGSSASCPVCGEDWDAVSIFLADFCPDCDIPREEAQAACANCGASLSWHGEEAFCLAIDEVRHAEMQARQAAIWELSAGVLAFVLLFVELVKGYLLPGFAAGMLIVSIPVVLIFKGVNDTFSARRLARFLDGHRHLLTDLKKEDARLSPRARGI